METPVFLSASSARLRRRRMLLLFTLAASTAAVCYRGIMEPVVSSDPPAFAMAPGVTTSSMPAGSGAGSVTLAWDAAPEPLTGYIMCWGQQSTLAGPENSQYVGNVLEFTIGNLAPGTQYYFTVKALNAAGQSGFSNEVTAYAEAGRLFPKLGKRAAPMQAGPGTSSSTTTSIPSEGTAQGAPSTTTETQGRRSYLLAGRGKGLQEYGTVQPGSVVAFDEGEIKGNLSIDWPEYQSLSGEARLATGDIDGDKFDEIIIGLGPVPGNAEIPGGKFEIFDDDFTSLGWGRIEWTDYNSENGESWPACGDIDGDGRAEILIGLGAGGNGLTEIFKFRDGKAVHEKWVQVGWEEYCAAGGGVRPACGNVTADRKNEIVLGLYPAGSFLPEGKFEVLDGQGEELAWGAVDWDEYTGTNGETRPACGNMDAAPHDEILLGLGEGSAGKIPVFSFDMGRIILTSWLQTGQADNPGKSETRLACGDVDGDGRGEVLIGFGESARGELELHADLTREFQLISRLQVPEEYISAISGEIFPAIKATNSKPVPE